MTEGYSKLKEEEVWTCQRAENLKEEEGNTMQHNNAL